MRQLSLSYRIIIWSFVHLDFLYDKKVSEWKKGKQDNTEVMRSCRKNRHEWTRRCLKEQTMRKDHQTRDSHREIIIIIRGIIIPLLFSNFLSLDFCSLSFVSLSATFTSFPIIIPFCCFLSFLSFPQRFRLFVKATFFRIRKTMWELWWWRWWWKLRSEFSYNLKVNSRNIRVEGLRYACCCHQVTLWQKMSAEMLPVFSVLSQTLFGYDYYVIFFNCISRQL